jgi:hypothetical protein
MTEQRAADRRLVRDPARCGVALTRADDVVLLGLAHGAVPEPNVNADVDRATDHQPLDDVRAPQSSFEIGNAPLQPRLLFLRLEVLGILRKLSTDPERLPQALRDLLPALAPQPFELALKPLLASRCENNPCMTPSPIERTRKPDLTRACQRPPMRVRAGNSTSDPEQQKPVDALAPLLLGYERRIASSRCSYRAGTGIAAVDVPAAHVPNFDRTEFLHPT